MRTVEHKRTKRRQINDADYTHRFSPDGRVEASVRDTYVQNQSTSGQKFAQAMEQLPNTLKSFVPIAEEIATKDQEAGELHAMQHPTDIVDPNTKTGNFMIGYARASGAYDAQMNYAKKASELYAQFSDDPQEFENQLNLYRKDALNGQSAEYRKAFLTSASQTTQAYHQKIFTEQAEKVMTNKRAKQNSLTGFMVNGLVSEAFDYDFQNGFTTEGAYRALGSDPSVYFDTEDWQAQIYRIADNTTEQYGGSYEDNFNMAVSQVIKFAEKTGAYSAMDFLFKPNLKNPETIPAYDPTYADLDIQGAYERARKYSEKLEDDMEIAQAKASKTATEEYYKTYVNDLNNIDLQDVEGFRNMRRVLEENPTAFTDSQYKTLHDYCTQGVRGFAMESNDELVNDAYYLIKTKQATLEDIIEKNGAMKGWANGSDQKRLIDADVTRSKAPTVPQTDYEKQQETDLKRLNKIVADTVGSAGFGSNNFLRPEATEIQARIQNDVNRMLVSFDAEGNIVRAEREKIFQMENLVHKHFSHIIDFDEYRQAYRSFQSELRGLERDGFKVTNTQKPKAPKQEAPKQEAPKQEAPKPQAGGQVINIDKATWDAYMANRNKQ